MGHFAKVENGKVTKVIVAEQEFINSGVVGNPHHWIRTSYNTRGGIHYDPITKEPSSDQNKALRKNYAGKGYTYDTKKDAFIPPKPYDSWALNDESCLWDPPTPYPDDGKNYKWNEENVSWIEITGEE